MAAAANPRAAKQPSPHPLTAPAFPIPVKWGHRRPPHNRADSRRSAAALPGDRIQPPAPDSVPHAVLPSSLALAQGKPVHTVAKCSSGSGRGGGGGDEDAGLEELRAKLIREAADRIGAVTVTPAEQPSVRPSPPPPPPPPPPTPSAEAAAAAAAASTRPWNLRSCRRSWPAPGAAPVATPAPERGQRTSRMRPAEAATAAGEKKRPWPKISITLTPEEIEEDIYALTGSRPRRRPKKRLRAIQRQLDTMYPGQWLPEIIPESYKVEES